MKIMKRILSLALAAILLLQLPVPAMKAEENLDYTAYSEDSMLMECKKDEAPVREGPGKKYDTRFKIVKESVMEVLDSTKNEYGHTWYHVSFYGEEGWIYEENVKYHRHSYQQLRVRGVSYHYCNCGNVYSSGKSDVGLSDAQTSAVAAMGGSAAILRSKSLALAGGLALADSPAIPVGDILGVIVLACTELYLYENRLPIASEVQKLSEKLDFDKYKKENDRCSIASYQAVVRTSDKYGLHFIDDNCMNFGTAYAYVYLGGDVYTRDGRYANLLANFAEEGCFEEAAHDGSNHYRHYHLGQKETKVSPRYKIGGHIFYGVNGNNLRPARAK